MTSSFSTFVFHNLILINNFYINLVKILQDFIFDFDEILFAILLEFNSLTSFFNDFAEMILKKYLWAHKIKTKICYNFLLNLEFIINLGLGHLHRLGLFIQSSFWDNSWNSKIVWTYLLVVCLIFYRAYQMEPHRTLRLRSTWSDACIFLVLSSYWIEISYKIHSFSLISDAPAS